VPLRQPALAGPGAAATSGLCPHNENILQWCCELTAKSVRALRGKHPQQCGAAMLTELTRDGQSQLSVNVEESFELTPRQGASQGFNRPNNQRDLKQVDTSRMSWSANTDKACCETAGIATHRSKHI